MLANPYAILAIVLFYFASLGGVGYKAYRIGEEHVIAEQAKTEQLIEAVTEKAQQGAAEAIARIEIKNVTIRQKAETITREVSVYSECQHDPAGLQLINDALNPANGQSAGKGELPGAGPAH